jgi:hypothetical protein
MKTGMKKMLILAVGLFLLGTPVAALAFDKEMNDAGFKEDAGVIEKEMDDAAIKKDADRAFLGDKAFRFNTMVAVSGSLVGSDIIREVPAGGAPWVIDSARGKLTAAGKLNINVKGLVLEDSGVNPSETFGGLVSCLDADGNTANFSTTGVFPADTDGNAKISETLSITKPCLAPIIFVTGSAGQWFAATGIAMDAVEPPADEDPDELPDDEAPPDEDPVKPEKPKMADMDMMIAPQG